MKNLIKLLNSRAEAKGLEFNNNKDIDFILSTIEAWAWGLELNKKEEKDFWKAKNKLNIITMSEICKEVMNLKRSINKRINEK